MKKFKYIVLSGLVGMALWSCEDDKLGPVIQNNGGLAITAPTAGSSWVLVDTLATQPLPAITWTGIDFGFEAGTAYKLEMDLAGNNFADPAVLGNVNGESVSVQQGDLNNILLAKEQEGGVPVNIDMRVIGTLTADVTPDTSDVVTISVTPYASNVVIPQLQVPGSYQGWAPDNNTTIIFSPKSNNQYEGYLNFGEENAKYKYTIGPSWDTNYGDTGDDGTLDQNGTDIPAGASGVYKLNVDLTSFTHTRLRTDWGIIGSATAGGWDSDQNMTFDAGTGRFTATLDLVAGEIKFRANDDWAINFGDDGNNKTLEYGAANIPVTEAGNYTIDLLIVGVAKYKYTITKN
jgi:hypothetical protein